MDATYARRGVCARAQAFGPADMVFGGDAVYVAAMTLTIPLPVATVFVTEDLASRRVRTINPLLRKEAVQRLTRQMLDSSDQVLSGLVDTALDLCRAVTGGLSLYDADTRPDIFVWKHLRGTFERFDGGTTPRDYSPCGVTLDRREPILVRQPERVYSWLVDAGVGLPECLLVPLLRGDGEPLGTLWVVSPAEGMFDRADVEVLEELAAIAGVALKLAQTDRLRQEALERQALLTNEMSHRVKNVLAVVDVLLRQSVNGAVSATDFANRLSGRVHALAVAHDRFRSPDDQTMLRDIIAAILQPFGRPGLKIDGPDVMLGPVAAQGFALLFHELATNAAKYGALSVAAGQLDVTWQVDGDHVAINWRETNGPAIAAPPEEFGFGSKLAAITIRTTLKGQIKRNWAQSGLVVTLSTPLALTDR